MTISQVIQLAAIVDRGFKIGVCRDVLHCSKLSIAGCNVTLVEVIDGPLEGFSDFGRDIRRVDRTIVIKGHYYLGLERRPKLALSNAINAIKGQIGDCWLIRFIELILVWRALGERPRIAITRDNMPLQDAKTRLIFQSMVVPQESD